MQTTSELCAIFSTRLKRLRNGELISQEELAKKAGLSRYVISHMETGRKLPSIHELIKLADYFHVTTDYLLGRKEK